MNQCPACKATNSWWVPSCGCGERLADWPYFLGILGGFAVPIILIVGGGRLGLLSSSFWREGIKAVAQLGIMVGLACWSLLVKDPRERRRNTGGTHSSAFPDDWAGDSADGSADCTDSSGGDCGGGD